MGPGSQKLPLKPVARPVGLAVMPRLTPKTATLAALGLVFVGCLPVTGYLVDSRVLRGLGAATAAAPFPKVFSDVDGLETFASDFTLHWRDGRGGAHALAEHGADGEGDGDVESFDRVPPLLSPFSQAVVWVLRLYESDETNPSYRRMRWAIVLMSPLRRLSCLVSK